MNYIKWIGFPIRALLAFIWCLLGAVLVLVILVLAPKDTNYGVCLLLIHPWEWVFQID